MGKKPYILSGLVILALGLVVGLILTSKTGKAVNPEGATTTNLRAIIGPLKDFVAREGKLPESLSQLGVSPEALLDGNGRPFILVHRIVAADRPGHGHYVIVGMSRPVKRHLFSKPWWYAIVQKYPDSNEIEIRSGSGEEGRQRLAAEYD